MAESSNVFYIRAQAQGFDRVSSAARKLTEDFKATGRAGQQMGNQVAQGLTRMHHHPHRGSHAPRPGARHPHRHHGAGVVNFPNQQGFGGGGGGGGAGGGGFPPGQGPPGGGGGPGGPRGGFLQGLLQGGTQGFGYLPRGPGMLAQTAGYTVGNLGRSVLGSMTGGPEALLGGLGSVPLVGQFLSQALGGGIQAGRQEAAYQTQISNMMPYIDDTHGAFTPRMDRQRERLGAVGGRYGMSAGRTLEHLAQAVAASGGTVRDLGEERVDKILAAQKGYGIDAGTGAVFARGADLGATGDADAEGTAIRGGRRLGLKGSELIQYVKGIASHIQAFAQTGIKVDGADQNDAARMFQSLGGPTMTGQRAAMLGQGFEQTANSIAANGPQDSNQSALLMAAGWNPEDPSTYLQALRNLEDPKKRAKYEAEAEDQVMNANRNLDPLQRAEVLRKFRESNTGVTLTHTEADAAIKSRGKNRHAARDALGAAQMESARPLPDEVEGQGRSNVSLAEGYATATENRREAIGKEEMKDVLMSDFNAQVLANTKAARFVGDNLMKAGNFLTGAGRDVVAAIEWDPSSQPMPKPH